MDWQLSWIAATQQHSSLTQLMKWISFLGNEEFFLLMIPFVYLCVDARIGLRLGLIVLLGDALNGVLKLLFHSPRPYWLDSRLQISTDPSYGMPSSHAQNGAATWLFLASQIRRGWGWALAGTLIIVIGLSRIFLGVHFPTDVVAGWFIGVLFLLAYLHFEPRVSRLFRTLGVWGQFAIVAGVCCALIVVGVVVKAALSGTTDPESWAHLSAEARSLQAIVSRTGGIFGLGVGAILARRYALFHAGGPLLNRAARFVIGVGILLALWAGLSKTFPREPETVGLVFRFVRYAIMTGWITFVAPWLFLKMGLATPARARESRVAS